MSEKVGRKIQIGILFDTVTLSIHCGSEYEAEVFYDDLIERMKAGEGFSIAVPAPHKEGVK